MTVLTARKRQHTGEDADIKTVLKTCFTSSTGRDVPLSGPILQADSVILISLSRTVP